MKYYIKALSHAILTGDALTVNIDRNVAAPKQPAR